ncbi:MAG: GNAT family N-acetyltransferase [Pseudomonadota bacterium]
MEEQVGSGEFWTHESGSYGIIYGKTLVEFFSTDSNGSGILLRELYRQNGFHAALVKSFDRDFMHSCAKLGWASSVAGFLFRERIARDQTAFPGAEMRAAIAADATALWAINDDFFESKGEIVSLARTSKLWTVQLDGKTAGCGVSNRFIEDCEAVDVGMLVGKDFRRRGLGTYIVNQIANNIEKYGLRPICGCGASNLASKATLERAGFVSKHQLLSFKT